MEKNSSILLTGEDLTVEKICKILDDPACTVEISSDTLKKIAESKAMLDRELEHQIIYGINTGFGPMASHMIGHSQLVELQQNLIRSHAVGIGDPIDPLYVLAAMVIRLNTLVKGNSGVSLALIEHLRQFINYRIIPVVPEHGAVGTSGDLVQLSHIALSLLGEGRVFYEGKIQPTQEVIKGLGLSPYVLQPKEGLALINGTAMMTAISALLCQKAQTLIELSIKTGVLSLELAGGYKDSISEELQLVRPHAGQIEVARRMREILASSKLMNDRSVLHNKRKQETDVYQISQEVQQVYSIRCIPQIVGPIVETLRKTMAVVEIEMNSTTDNPVVDVAHGKFIHGGNFHGDYIACHIDYLKIAMVKLTMLSERRANFFLHHKLNGKFPPFMNLKKPGLTLGLQGLQFVATSTTAQNQTLAFPQYVHSIPTNGDNQDVVSMGTDAALLAARVIDNAFVVLAIEAVVLAQGVDYANAQGDISQKTRSLFDSVRSISPKVVDDRTMTLEMNQLVDFLKKQHE